MLRSLTLLLHQIFANATAVFVNFFVSSTQIRKLTYLQMIGYNVSWAAFSIVEVMSQTRFAHKRVGYLAANQVRV